WWGYFHTLGLLSPVIHVFLSFFVTKGSRSWKSISTLLPHSSPGCTGAGIAKNCAGIMQNQVVNQRENNRLPNSAAGQRQGWKGQTYVVPAPSRRSFLLKASALQGLQRFDGQSAPKQPVTVVVPALFNHLPA